MFTWSQAIVASRKSSFTLWSAIPLEASWRFPSQSGQEPPLRSKFRPDGRQTLPNRIMEGLHAQNGQSCLHDSRSAVARLKFSGRYFYPAFHSARMLNKADVEGGPCKYAACKNGNEFHNLAHQFLPATAASSSSHEERHNGKHPKQQVIDRSRHRISGCEILSYRDAAKPEHQSEFREEQEAETNAAHSE